MYRGLGGVHILRDKPTSRMHQVPDLPLVRWCLRTYFLPPEYVCLVAPIPGSERNTRLRGQNDLSGQLCDDVLQSQLMSGGLSPSRPQAAPKSTWPMSCSSLLPSLDSLIISLWHGDTYSQPCGSRQSPPTLADDRKSPDFLADDRKSPDFYRSKQG